MGHESDFNREGQMLRLQVVALGKYVVSEPTYPFSTPMKYCVPRFLLDYLNLKVVTQVLL